LEIGGGPGNITEKLAKKAGHVYTLEIDKRFQPILESLKIEKFIALSHMKNIKKILKNTISN